MTGRTEHMISNNNKNYELETTASYKIGKTAVSIDRVFRKDNAETLGDVLIKLMKEDAKST